MLRYGFESVVRLPAPYYAVIPCVVNCKHSAVPTVEGIGGSALGFTFPSVFSSSTTSNVYSQCHNHLLESKIITDLTASSIRHVRQIHQTEAMEADWTETLRLSYPGALASARSSRVTAFCFDPTEELFWVGNDAVSARDHDNLLCQNVFCWSFCWIGTRFFSFPSS